MGRRLLLRQEQPGVIPICAARDDKQRSFIRPRRLEAGEPEGAAHSRCRATPRASSQPPLAPASTKPRCLGAIAGTVACSSFGFTRL